MSMTSHACSLDPARSVYRKHLGTQRQLTSLQPALETENAHEISTERVLLPWRSIRSEPKCAETGHIRGHVMCTDSSTDPAALV